MIQLDYQTNNKRWGWSGIRYSNWGNYAFALGFLANIDHYRNGSGNLIEVHIEQNNEQGAWGREGRIQFYGTDFFLSLNLPDWHACKSAGNGSITCRINSNDYIYSLVEDYDFIVRKAKEYTTADIFPPQDNAYDFVWLKLFVHLRQIGVTNITDIQKEYKDGWNL